MEINKESNIETDLPEIDLTQNYICDFIQY